jgi:hypothetical protein
VSSAMAHIVHVLIGDGHSVADAAVKTSALFLTATTVFRLIAGRTLPWQADCVLVSYTVEQISKHVAVQ